jgi:hypothetical protein
MLEALGWAILFALLTAVTILGFVLNLSWKSKLILAGLVLLIGGPGLILPQEAIISYSNVFRGNQTFASATFKTLGNVVMGYQEWDRMTGELAPTYQPIQDIGTNLSENSTRGYYTFMSSQMWYIPLVIELYILVCLILMINAIIPVIVGKQVAEANTQKITAISIILAAILGTIMTKGYPGFITLIKYLIA